MDPVLLATLIRAGAEGIAMLIPLFRSLGRPEVAADLSLALERLGRSDATLDDVIARARREQGA